MASADFPQSPSLNAANSFGPSLLSSTITSAPSASSGARKVAKPCRNIAMYGYCKFQGRGCEYSHDPVPDSMGSLPQDDTFSDPTMARGGYTPQGQMEGIYTPRSGYPYPFPEPSPPGSSYLPQQQQGPYSAPSARVAAQTRSGLMLGSSPDFRPLGRSFEPSSGMSPPDPFSYSSPIGYNMQQQNDLFPEPPPLAGTPPLPLGPAPTRSGTNNGGYSLASQPMRSQAASASRGGYGQPSKPFYPGTASVPTTIPPRPQPQQSQSFATPPSPSGKQPGMVGGQSKARALAAQRGISLQGVVALGQGYRTPDDMRKELSKKSALSLAKADPSDPEQSDMPTMVRLYHTLLPLERKEDYRTSKVYKVPTACVKALNTSGQTVLIRRIKCPRPFIDLLSAVCDRWRAIVHPNVVGLREAFTSTDFGAGGELLFIHEFFPGAQTLESRLKSSQPSSPASSTSFGPSFSADAIASQSNLTPPPEQFVWSVLCQVVCAARRAHNAGLALRGMLDPSKVLLDPKNRVKLSGSGIMDCLQPDQTTSIPASQVEDLASIGKLALYMACQVHPSQLVPGFPIDQVTERGYSTELRDFISFALGAPEGSPQHISELCGALADRMADELEASQSHGDMAEAELEREMENGRLMRVLAKLNFILERPEHEMDPTWAETGDRYLLKLFRDYLFHQRSEDGTAVVDYAHVLECLNKLDVGVNERILLMGRDGQSLLVVSYSDLKRCIEGAFAELVPRLRTQQQI